MCPGVAVAPECLVDSMRVGGMVPLMMSLRRLCARMAPAGESM